VSLVLVVGMTNTYSVFLWGERVWRKIQKEGFREYLYYRLMVMEIDIDIDITIPPLRERRDNIPLLTHYFLNKPACGIMAEVLGVLLRYDRPAMCVNWKILCSA